jgi:hypothetical protein
MFFVSQIIAMIVLTNPGSMKYGFDRHVFDVSPRKYSHTTFVSKYLKQRSIRRANIHLRLAGFVNYFSFCPLP